MDESNGLPPIPFAIKYTVVLIPDNELPGYTAVVPMLPGCVSEGTTLESALDNIKEAIELHISQSDELVVESEDLIVVSRVTVKPWGEVDAYQ